MDIHRAPLNLDRFLTHLEPYLDSIDVLRDLGAMDDAAYWSDRRNQDLVRYHFIMAAQNSIDICQHIVGKFFGKTVDEYGGCFVLLGEAGLMSEESASSMKALAGLRNIQVHLYAQTDDQRRRRFLLEDLGQLRRFGGWVRELVKEQ